VTGANLLRARVCLAANSEITSASSVSRASNTPENVLNSCLASFDQPTRETATHGGIAWKQRTETRMRRHVIVSLTTAGLSAGFIAAASAADLPRPTPAPVYTKAPPAPTFSWGGFYVGANAGFIDSTGRTTTGASVLSDAADPAISTTLAAAATNQLNGGNSGFLGGVQFGYNYVLTPSFIAGWETDIQGSSLRRSSNSSNAAPLFGTNDFMINSATNTSVSNKLDYLGTLRARLGVTATPSVLLYGTGGLAYGGVRSSTSTSTSTTNLSGDTLSDVAPVSTAGGSFSGTRTGWTAGAGVEWMFSPGWTTKLEYLHYDLGGVTYATGGTRLDMTPIGDGEGVATIATSTTTQFKGDIVRVGVNYMFH
jgi:outer membrane immunogenic protein